MEAVGSDGGDSGSVWCHGSRREGGGSTYVAPLTCPLAVVGLETELICRPRLKVCHLDASINAAAKSARACKNENG